MSDETLFTRPFIAYDGSQNSQYLLSTFLKMHDKFEKSSFVFVYDPRKNYVPANVRGPAIQGQLKEKTEGMQQVTIRIVQKTGAEEGQAPKNTNEHLLEQYFVSKSTFIMLGFFGSKGNKPRHEELSSRVSRFVYDSKATSAIIKHEPRQNNSVIFCFDGSEISTDGLNKSAEFCRLFNYSLSIIHAFNQDTKSYSTRIKKMLKSFQLAQKSIKVESIVIEADLLEYLKQKQQGYDWIMLTKNGYRGEISKKVYVGSTTTDILTKVHTNLIVIS